MTSMLPAMPPAFGNLRDVFRSAEASVKGEENPCGLAPVSSAIVIMVDGLGARNLENRAQDAPFLSSSRSEDIYCGFPSTTAVSIASFASGRTSSEHGLFGYRIYDRSRKESVNLLSGLDQYGVLDYLLADPISTTSSLVVHAVTLSAYEHSGMTRATMHKAVHHFADTIEQRFKIAAELARQARSLIYLYVPELDQCAHKFGVASGQWDELLRRVELSAIDLAAQIPDSTGVLLTADHGILDVDSSKHIYLDLITELDRKVVDVGGDPRVAYLYLTPQANRETIRRSLREELGERASVLDPTELVNHGLWQESLLAEDDLLPDLVLVALDEVAFYHRDFAKATSMQMIGQHGGLSDTEIRIPLIKFGAYGQERIVRN
ncbi:MAG: hypothetical protein RL149_983 [Actinomycetota bacterium]